MKYPIGIQTFSDIINGGYVYVDKTNLIYELTNNLKYVFLSRPRRFGKSLLLSTIEAYFSGQRELFDGMDIATLETEWNIYPVIHLDLNTGLYKNVQGLIDRIDNDLNKLEKKYDIEKTSENRSLRFENIIIGAYNHTGQKVVVLIDEYDKPLLEAIGNQELQEVFRDQLRAIYSVLKSQDKYIRFGMLTGVTKFGHLSVFSGLNNIKDISFDDKYASICGITKDEIHRYFNEPLHALADKNGKSVDEMIEKLRLMYDGYRFTQREVKVFNPFSLLNAFSELKLDSYWFASGTPRYLAHLLTLHHYDVSDLDGVMADQNRLSNIDTDSSDPVPVIYQSGYLTIKGYDDETEEYVLGFPNQEVRKGFMEYLIPFYLKRDNASSRFDISQFKREIIKGEPDGFMSRIKSLTADISYDILANCENDFHNLLFMLFTFASARPIVERHTSNGRIDMVVETDKYVYVMEFKIDGSAQTAIDQINSHEYTLPWAIDHRKVYKIGANFSTVERRLTEYIIQ